MAQHTIMLFMWGYQPHYRINVELRMNSVLKELGVAEAGAECLLVGARIPGRTNPNDVCLEPEDGKWPIQLFSGLLHAVEEQVANHPLQNVYYGDEPRMRDKQENIRRDSVRRAVEAALAAYDCDNQVLSFAGSPAPVGDYYVVPVIQIPTDLFKRFRPLREPVSDGRITGSPSMIHASVSQILSDAHDELLRPEPGRALVCRSRSAEEIVRLAAASFMYSLGLAIGDQNYGSPNLFERFNLISSVMYEGREGTGRMLLAKAGGGAVDMLLELAEPVPFREPRWSRKVLQMASSEPALIADCEKVLGLGTIAEGIDSWATQDVFEIEFLGHYHWRLSCGDDILLISRYGSPSLPQEPFPRDVLKDTYQRLFPSAGEQAVADFLAVFETAVGQRHGSMVVVADDAAAEAERLGGQGTKVSSTKLTPKLYERVSGIDGSIIVDPKCICHAIGVILDGPARPECTPSRGSRYNSAVRYIGSTETPRLAVVVSDDRTVDVIPVLRQRIPPDAVIAAVEALEAATHENYHKSRTWLDEHRFYLDADQCKRVNAALDRIENSPKDVGQIVIVTERFQPHPAMNESYLLKS